MMGSGKSTVGAALAARTGDAFVDLDAAIVADAGRSIAELFASEGEAGFRARETQTLARVLASPRPCVLACGGGVVLRDENVALLRERATVVWLDATVETLAARVGDGAGRPLLAGDPAARLASLDAQRRHRYAACADVVVAVDGRSVDEIVDALAGALAEVPA